MESHLTIKVDATLKEEPTAFAREGEQIAISPDVMEMTSDLHLPSDLDDKAIFIEAMEEKHK